MKQNKSALRDCSFFFSRGVGGGGRDAGGILWRVMPNRGTTGKFKEGHSKIVSGLHFNAEVLPECLK